MKFAAFLCLFLVCACSLNFAVVGFYGFNIIEFLLGSGSFFTRLFYVLSGVAADFLIICVLIYKPFKTLAK